MMESRRFDELARGLGMPRRSLLGGALTLAGTQLGLMSGEARKKRKRKPKGKQPKPNIYGCLNVGQPCRGESSHCCSGICEGSKPKKGKKDASRCAAHDASICKVDFDVCSTGGIHYCNAQNANCACALTTGNAGFCGDFSANVGDELCRDCSQDADCEEEFGQGAACVVFGGICESTCAKTGGTACMPPCPGPDVEQ